MIVWSFITENTGEQSGSSLMSFWQLGDHEEADADTGNSRATSPSQTTEPTSIVFIHTHKHSGMPRHEFGKVSSTSTAPQMDVGVPEPTSQLFLSPSRSSGASGCCLCVLLASSTHTCSLCRLGGCSSSPGDWDEVLENSLGAFEDNASGLRNAGTHNVVELFFLAAYPVSVTGAAYRTHTLFTPPSLLWSMSVPTLPLAPSPWASMARLLHRTEEREPWMRELQEGPFCQCVIFLFHSLCVSPTACFQIHLFLKLSS